MIGILTFGGSFAPTTVLGLDQPADVWSSRITIIGGILTVLVKQVLDARKRVEEANKVQADLIEAKKQLADRLAKQDEVLDELAKNLRTHMQGEPTAPPAPPASG